NAPQAVAALHDLVSAGNDRLTVAEKGDAAARAEVAALGDALVDMGDRVFGLGLEAALADAAALERQLEPLVGQLLEQRRLARADKDFAAADRIRDELA